MGYPINIQESDGTNRIYDFPVMENGEIFAMLTIYDENGEYYTQLDENLMAEKLNELQNVSSQSSPISLVSNNAGFLQ